MSAEIDFDTVLESAMSDVYEGWCTACGESRSGVEPDAHEYECWSCGEHQVYGAEELIAMGLVA